MKHIEVVAAVILDQNHRVFCAKRKDDGELALKWEFPGGKIEENESHQEALKREILEELSATISVDRYLMTVHHTYNSFKLTLHAYLCRVEQGQLTLSEHVDAQWLDGVSLSNLDWAAADLPVVNYLTEHLGLEGLNETD